MCDRGKNCVCRKEEIFFLSTVRCNDSLNILRDLFVNSPARCTATTMKRLPLAVCVIVPLISLHTHTFYLTLFNVNALPCCLCHFTTYCFNVLEHNYFVFSILWRHSNMATIAKSFISIQFVSYRIRTWQQMATLIHPWFLVSNQY